MRRPVFIIAALALTLALVGCGRRQQTLEEMQEPMSMDELNKLSVEGQMSVEPKAAATQPVATAVSAVTQDIPVAATQATEAYTKPTNQDIQTALKNANFYSGAIDGKIGPASKKAIEEFQKANNLNADGKVGSKTWAALSKYLVIVPAEATTKKKR